MQCRHGSQFHFSCAHILLLKLLCNFNFLIVFAIADATFIMYKYVCVWMCVCVLSCFCNATSIYERILCDDKRIKLRLCHKCAANVAKVVT